MAKAIHPGIILKRELEARELTIDWLAEQTGFSHEDLELLVSEAISIASDLAFELSRVLGTTKEFWLNLQRKYDEATKESLINCKWVVVGQPWGDGTTINAFAQDAAGECVAACDNPLFFPDLPSETYLETPYDIAEHIVKIHNAWWERKQQESKRD